MEFTALHRALGLSAGPLVDRLINDAVAAQLAETDDLDFKRKLPAAKELATSDYPKDVAAMANSGGGTIVFGVAETNKLASGRVDVGEVDENYQRTLVRVPVASIHPPVFGVKVYPLGDPSMRAAVVVVPASIDGPHLIYRGECFGAPVRNDADTEWMKERQIEAMYRARFDERRHIAERLTTLYDELAQARDTTERAWLIAVAHPRIPAQTSERIDRQYARDLFDKAADQSLVYAGRNQGTHIFETIDRHNPRPGLRRWIAPTTTDRARWGEAQASIHHDGSISVAAAVGGHRGYPNGETRPGSVVYSYNLECMIADLFALIRVAHRHRGTTEYEVRVGIEWSGTEPLLVQTTDQHGFDFAGNSHPLTRYVPVDATIDAGADDQRFGEQLRDFAQDCVNQGGVSLLKAIGV